MSMTNQSPVLEIAAISIDSEDAERLSRFYTAALGAEHLGERDEWRFIKLGQLLINFRTVEGFKRPTWGTSEIPMQMHFEMYVNDIQRAKIKLEKLGATLPDYQPEGSGVPYIVMLDPSGHPFCIFTRSDNSDGSAAD
jgi:predicted enzyme related to lactoylglutathione lyase